MENKVKLKGQATLSVDGKVATLPVYGGTLGPDVVDIASLYKQTGMFTLDPGFTSTGSCESQITYIDGDKGLSNWRSTRIFLRFVISCSTASCLTQLSRNNSRLQSRDTLCCMRSLIASLRAIEGMLTRWRWWSGRLALCLRFIMTRPT